MPDGPDDADDPISIHSPRMGRDGAKPTADKCHKNFNPLSPHGERPTGVVRRGGGLRFQSTLPAWGETCGAKMDGEGDAISIHSPRMGRDQPFCEAVYPLHMISIHSPRMGRDQPVGGLVFDDAISIHSPRMGRDGSIRREKGMTQFQSTLPAWGETGAESHGRSGKADFNPLSPHGERPA